MRRLLGSVIGLLVGIMAAAPVADAKIVVGQSIAGVKLGSTKTQVKKVLGPPTGSLAGEFSYPPSVGLRIYFKRGRVDRILSYSKRQKTAAGITIGSSRSQVKRAYPQARCIEGQNPPYVYCVVGAHAQGRKSYTGFLFEVATGGVVEIELGFGSVSEALSKP